MSQISICSRLAIASLFSFALLLTACSSQPKVASPEEQAQKLQAVMDKGGYAPASQLDFDNVSEIWNHDGAELEVEMIAPRQASKYPLIIYLPSLGEDAKAGRLWRETWVKAGYAVFSMQPRAIGQALKELEHGKPGGDGKGKPEEDDDDRDDDKGGKSKGFFGKSGGDGEKSSRSGRSSELRYLGHEYFAVDALKKRMEQLYWAYQQLKIRVDLGASLFSEADLSNTVLAGYDLGAQTVTAVLGEDFMTPLPENRDIHPVAAIILSPSIDLAEGNVRSRFQKLQIPLLVITGSDDNDPYAISSASVRAAVWEFSPAGGKYLLQLTGDVHSLLAGKDMGGRFNAKENKEKDSGGNWFGGGGNRFDQSGQQSGANIYGNTRYRDNSVAATNQFPGSSQQYGGGGSGGQGGSGRGHSNGNSNNGGHTKGDGEKKSQELGYKQVAAVYSASTAFLDKVVKNDEFAQFWIDDKASNWLDRIGALKIR
jgi:hypothetical protein